MEIQELQAEITAKVGRLIVLKQSNANTLIGKTERGVNWLKKHEGKDLDADDVDTYIQAGHIKSSVPQSVVDEVSTLIKDTKGLLGQLDIKVQGERNAKPKEDVTNFRNVLIKSGKDNDRESAYAMMREKLKDLDSSVYEFVNYDADHKDSDGYNDGLFTVKVQTKGGIQKNASAGSWVTIAYNNPGSLENKIKEHRHINGKLKEVITAS